jgi:hypothetical protein
MLKLSCSYDSVRFVLGFNFTAIFDRKLARSVGGLNKMHSSRKIYSGPFFHYCFMCLKFP